MEFCRHQRYKTITHILQPKYSTDQVLISINAIHDNVEHYLLKFVKCNKYDEWYYFSKNDIIKRPTQKNGNGLCYLVPMSCRKSFTPVKVCEHDLK